MQTRLQAKILIPAVSIVILLLSALLSLSVGAVNLSFIEILTALMEGADSASVSSRIIFHVRLPRLLAAALAGAGLAASGVLIQTVLANPLASPGIIGVNAGAGFTAALAMALFPSQIFMLPIASFCGAFGTMLLVYSIARKAGASRITLVLSGVAISGLMTAGINTIAIIYPDILRGLRDFQIGGFSNVSLSSLISAGVVILLGLGLALIFAGELDVLGLGEQTAFSLGLNVPLYRFLFLALGAALAGAVVSFAGLIGFVGLIVPHMARFILTKKIRQKVHSGKRMLLVLSALMGAIFLIISDTAARTIFAPFELPVGILIAYIGVPFFLWLLLGNTHKY